MTGNATSAAAASKAFFMHISTFRHPPATGYQLAGLSSQAENHFRTDLNVPEGPERAPSVQPDHAHCPERCGLSVTAGKGCKHSHNGPYLVKNTTAV
jgi:hypothetical protein